MEVEKKALLKALKEMKSKGYDMLKCIVAIDESNSIKLNYMLYSTALNTNEFVSVEIGKENLNLESVKEVYNSADWYEREIFEMFGVGFTNRKLKRLLLEEWNGSEFPMRKEFIWGKDYKKR